MAVLVEFEVPEASQEQMMSLERLTQVRGEALGRPPFTGCMFIAVTPRGEGFHFVSVWRTEDAFRTVMESMLGVDLAEVGARASDALVSPVLSMAIPGNDAP